MWTILVLSEPEKNKPFAECQFDSSEVRVVEKSGKHATGDQVWFANGTKKPGMLVGHIVAIGENAKDEGGEQFTAILLRWGYSGSLCVKKQCDVGSKVDSSQLGFY